jgi:hypothetical protein
MNLIKMQKHRAPLFIHIVAGSAGAGPVLVLFAIMQSKRTSLPGHLHASGHARNQGVCRAGRHQRLHFHTLDGHAVYTYRQQVSMNS